MSDYAAPEVRMARAYYKRVTDSVAAGDWNVPGATDDDPPLFKPTRTILTETLKELDNCMAGDLVVPIMPRPVIPHPAGRDTVVLYTWVCPVLPKDRQREDSRLLVFTLWDVFRRMLFCGERNNPVLFEGDGTDDGSNARLSDSTLSYAFDGIYNPPTKTGVRIPGFHATFKLDINPNDGSLR